MSGEREIAMHGRRRAGLSLIGLVVALGCLVILFALGLTALNRAMTGGGTASKGTVRSMSDQLSLYALYQSMAAGALDHDGRFIVPSELVGDGDAAVDITANLYSAMVMENYISPEQLISANEFSPYVEADTDYNYRGYDAVGAVFWDGGFVADLEVLSNVSFAHMPLYGKRFERYWGSGLGPHTALVGNRGPKDGKEDPESYTYGRDGRWAGHIVLGDGHIEHLRSFVAGSVFYRGEGAARADNIFAVEDGLEGIDAILSFTKRMTEDGPELQHD